jgi:hypothetical protein
MDRVRNQALTVADDPNRRLHDDQRKIEEQADPNRSEPTRKPIRPC